MKTQENILSQIFLFKDVEHKLTLNDLGETKNFKKGESIYQKSNFENALGILLSGKAEALSNGEVALKRFNPLSVFGAAAVFANNETYVSEIVAKSDCKVLFISEERLKELFKEYPQTAINYISFLSSKICFLNEKISLFTADSVQSKLYAYLSKNETAEKINMSALSKTLGIGRTSLYRALAELEQKNLIKKINGKVSVLK